MHHPEPRGATLLTALVVLLPASSAGVAADHGHDTSAGRSVLRDLVREFGDGTVVGPATDALAALGTPGAWRQLGLLFVGVGGILALAFGPVVALVAVHWTYRRLRRLFRTLVRTPRRAAGLAAAVTGVVTRRIIRHRTGSDPTGSGVPGSGDGDRSTESHTGPTDSLRSRDTGTTD